MENIYFFIDGSALLSDISKIISKHPELQGKKFNPVKFARLFHLDYNLEKYHQRNYNRVTFYFTNNDERVKELIVIPEYNASGIVEDLEIKYCGKKVRKIQKAHNWLEKNDAPDYVLDSLYRSEKAVDSQICCDSLVLLSQNKLSRLFLYTNDYDFIPLCKTLKSLGSNVNLIKLNDNRLNKDLIKEFDGFNCFEKEEILRLFD